MSKEYGNFKCLKRKLRKVEKDRDELVKSMENLHNAIFGGNDLKMIQDLLLEEDYLRALRVEPLF